MRQCELGRSDGGIQTHRDLHDTGKCLGERSGWRPVNLDLILINEPPQLDHSGSRYAEFSAGRSFNDATGFDAELVRVVRSPNKRVRVEEVADAQSKYLPTLNVGFVRSTPGLMKTLPLALPIHEGIFLATGAAGFVAAAFLVSVLMPANCAGQKRLARARIESGPERSTADAGSHHARLLI